MAKHTVLMPKNRADFDAKLKAAFHAGCSFGYSVEHTVDVWEQEELGAKLYVDEIDESECFEKLYELQRLDFEE